MPGPLVHETKRFATLRKCLWIALNGERLGELPMTNSYFQPRSAALSLNRRCLDSGCGWPLRAAAIEAGNGRDGPAIRRPLRADTRHTLAEHGQPRTNRARWGRRRVSPGMVAGRWRGPAGR